MRAARLGIAVLLIASLAACSGDKGDDSGDKSSDTSAAESTDGGPNQAPGDPSQASPPVAGATALPEPGQCWALSTEELDEGMAMVSTASAALDCSGEHNAITVVVVEIPDEQVAALEETVNAGTAVDPAHEESWQAVVGPACAAAFTEAFASGAVALEHEGVAAAYKASTLQGDGWLPTAADWQSGARWIRCDIANQNANPIPFDQPSIDLQTIPDELVACLNANVEGTFPVPCDDPLANAQALVTVELDAEATATATADYDAFKTDAADICADAVTTAFPNAGKPGLAALPIEFAFDGRFDCYVERTAQEPLITN